SILYVQWWRNRQEENRSVVNQGSALWLTTFFWQFGNFLLILAIKNGVAQTSAFFRSADFVREAALMCFPLLFGSLSFWQAPTQINRNPFGRLGRNLRYVLWPWTIIAVLILAASSAGAQLPSWAAPTILTFITLHLMLLYFVLFTVLVMGYREEA